MEPSSRRACFLEEDDGLASLVNMEAEFSGNHQNSNKPSNYLWSNPVCYSKRRSGSLRNLSSLVSDGSPKAIRFYETKFEEPHQPHFLETCFFCKKSIGDNKDIFMYRGDTPFCSEECRQEQIEMDEAKERNWNLSSSMQALRKKEKNKSNSSSPTKAQDYPSCAGTVAAA